MRRSSLFVLSIAAVVAACSASSSNSTGGDGGAGNGSGSGGGTGSGGGEGSGSGSGGGSASGAASHPAFPILVDQGGPILTAPKVVTVTFPSDVNAAMYQSFGTTVVNNAWWDTVRQGYCTDAKTCVGDGPAGTSVALSAAPGASYTDSADPQAASTLKGYITSLIPAQIPQPDAETILVFYLPATTTVTLDGAVSCTQFAGYHNSITSGGVSFTYAVVNECPAAQGSKLSIVEQATFAASHEIIEAATDPFQTPQTLGFYLNFNDASILPWNNIGGGEAADMCVDFLNFNQDSTTEGGFTVQRMWNNAAAAAGGDPCVPASSAVYYNVAPETWLQTLAVGASATFTADAFSTGDVPNWTVIGYDVNASSATNLDPFLTIAVTGGTGVTNGAKLSVKVTLNQDPSALPNYAQTDGATGLLISINSATPSKATTGHVWPFLVTTPGDASDAGLEGVDAASALASHAHVQARPRPEVTAQQWANLRHLFPNLKLD